MPECHPTVHGVLLLGQVQKQDRANSVPHYSEGDARALPAWHGPTRSRPACLAPAFLVANIFVLTGDIYGQGRGRRRAEQRGRTQEPEVWRQWGQGIRGVPSDGEGAKRGKAGEVKGDREATETTVVAEIESGRVRHIEDPPGGSQEYGRGGKYREGRTDT